MNRKLCNVAKVITISMSLALSVTAINTAYAERISIPLGQQGGNILKPRTGQTKEQVEAQFGQALSQRGPVGDPAIYTWEYAQFQVYFESDRVIHSVVKHQGSPR